eukprot:scaffold77807_cov27-Tisochrysis_lutea.AAC.3
MAVSQRGALRHGPAVSLRQWPWGAAPLRACDRGIGRAVKDKELQRCFTFKRICCLPGERNNNPIGNKQPLLWLAWCWWLVVDRRMAYGGCG